MKKAGGSFVIIFFLLAAFSSASGDAMKAQPKAAPIPAKKYPATNPRIQALIMDLNEANTADGVAQAFKRASLNEQELKQLRPMFEQGPLGQKIQRLVMQTRVHKKAAFETKKRQMIAAVQAKNKGLQERHQQMFSQGNQQAAAALNRFRAATATSRASTTADRRFPTPLTATGHPPSGSTIQSVNPVRLMAGQRITVIGSGFGSTPGRLAIVIDRNLFACETSSWSDTRVTATVPLQVQEAVREGEQRGIVWIKMGSGETGPWKEVTFLPDRSKLVPEITQLTPASIQPHNGQTIVISGKNFLSSQPGHATLRFATETTKKRGTHNSNSKL